MSLPIVSVSKESFKKHQIPDEFKIDVYPPVTAQDEPESFYRRLKNFIVNAMTNMSCGVMSRPYSYFTKKNIQTVHITVDLPPV